MPHDHFQLQQWNPLTRKWQIVKRACNPVEAEHYKRKVKATLGFRVTQIKDGQETIIEENFSITREETIS